MKQRNIHKNEIRLAILWTIIAQDYFIKDKLEEKKNDKKFVISIYQRLRFSFFKGLLRVCFNSIVLDNVKLDPAKEGNVSDIQIFCLHSYFYTCILQHCNV